MPLREAVVDAGRRALPADAADRHGGGGGRGVILFDPIFQGLAIALMAGEVASLLISRMAVPVSITWPSAIRTRTLHDHPHRIG